MEYETLLYDADGEIGILTLNRPRVVNAFNRQMVDELIDFWHKRHDDSEPDINVLGAEHSILAG